MKSKLTTNFIFFAFFSFFLLLMNAVNVYADKSELTSVERDLIDNATFRQNILEELAKLEKNDVDKLPSIGIAIVDSAKTKQVSDGEIDLAKIIEQNTFDNVTVSHHISKEKSLASDISVIKKIINNNTNNTRIIVLNTKGIKMTDWDAFWGYCGFFGNVRWNNLVKEAKSKGVIIVHPAGYNSNFVRGGGLCLNAYESIIVSGYNFEKGTAYSESNRGLSIDFVGETAYPKADGSGYTHYYNKNGEWDYGLPAAQVAADIALLYTLHPDVGVDEMSDNLHTGDLIKEPDFYGDIRATKRAATNLYFGFGIMDLKELNESLNYKNIEVNINGKWLMDEIDFVVKYLAEDNPHINGELERLSVTKEEYIEMVNNDESMGGFVTLNESYENFIDKHFGGYLKQGSGLKIIVNPAKLAAIEYIKINNTTVVSKLGQNETGVYEIVPDNLYTEEKEGLGLTGPIVIDIKFKIKLW